MTIRHKDDIEPEPDATARAECDTEGHNRWVADAEQAEGEADTEGHNKWVADAEQAEGEPDTEGHNKWG